ncbi:uncharacterized protein LOC111273719 [Varroa jacobsoni]|uniref:uncharacterized protein LOC111273719 n=1 Tax=Varroa jacobsoni TaxID=62625 RepID=UPI000BF84947|nr:uncharacterized protein LOC111273719 [Varroa jacobsoni]
MAVVEVAVQIEIEATVLHSEHSLDARSARPLWNDALVARTRRYRIALPLSETPSNDAADSSSVSGCCSSENNRKKGADQKWARADEVQRCRQKRIPHACNRFCGVRRPYARIYLSAFHVWPFDSGLRHCYIARITIRQE